MRRLALPLLSALALAAPRTPLAAQLAPQQPEPLRRAAETIAEADVRRRIGVIAHDSMMGRDTPSPGLEKTARWVADQLQSFGLKPGGDSGTFFQRYTIATTRFNAGASSVVLRAGNATATARFDTDARYAEGGTPARPVTGDVVLLGGRLDQRAIEGAALRGRVVLFVMDYTKPVVPQAELLQVAYGQGPAALAIISNRDSAGFAQRLRQQGLMALTAPVYDRPAIPAVEVREPVFVPVLRAAGVDLARVRASTVPEVRPLAGATATLTLRDTVLQSVTAPNTIGILEGSDPVLKNEYVFFTAHMDHIGITRGAPDSINNGADDDASGTVGVVELAEAFSRPGARPKRSLVFMTVSGEEKGLWGSEWYAEHPTVPLAQTVADINMDMIGRNWKDTIVAIGQEHSDLGATLARVNAAHPELGIRVIDDIWPEEQFYVRSDHFNFARKGVPILFFFNGVHRDYHRPSDEPAKIDAEKEARVLRMVYWIGQEVANAAARPQWNEESRKRIVEGVGH
ncbi:MAG TPA: M28 family peptidase [Gemmatimonadaceae bacterium]|nr:M28 family peptidase [Gemmatimonadaceae bacterium]